MDTTYTMIGGDGVHYGPVPLEQLKNWITEGRITADTKILRSDTNSWLPASQYCELGVRPTAPMPAALASPPASAARMNNPMLAHRVKQSANWFYWIAALSLVNTFIALSQGSIQFAVGLAITQLIGALAVQFNSAATVGLVLNILAAGIFALFGIFANKRQTWSFIVGMVFYSLDALLCLAFNTWLSLGFHVFVLYLIFKGLQANLQLNRENT